VVFLMKENKIYKFYEQVKQETLKVTWPTKHELLTSTAVVIFAVFVFSIVCLLVDYGIHFVMQMLLNIGK